MRELNASLLTGSITLPYCEPSPPITTAAADQKLFETGRLERRSKSKQASGLRERSGLAGGVAAALSGLGVLQVGRETEWGARSKTYGTRSALSGSLVGRTLQRCLPP